MLTLADTRLDQRAVADSLGDALIFAADPSQINKLIKKECPVSNDWLQQKAFFDYFIVGGDWDRDFSLVRDDRNYLEIVELLTYREAFRSSPSYARCVTEIRQGTAQKGIHGVPFATAADVDETFTFYLDLIDDMRRRGYQSILQTTKPSPERHIGVGVAQDGELFHFRTGHHRLAIAKQIGLKSVLVHVHCVHSDWARTAVKAHGGQEIDALKIELGRLAKEQGIGRDDSGNSHPGEQDVLRQSGIRLRSR